MLIYKIYFYLRHASPPVGLVRLAIVVSPAEAQPYQLRLSTITKSLTDQPQMIRYSVVALEVQRHIISYGH